VSTLVADPPPQAPPSEPPAQTAPAAETPAASETRCLKCGSPLAPGQDWCLQCGAGAPGSLAGTAHSWRSGGIVIAALVVLLAGAGAAAYAAWGKAAHSPKRPPALARSFAPTSPATGLGATGATGALGTRTLPGTSANPALRIGALAKLPKIPFKVATPKITLPTIATTPASTGTTTPKTTTTPTTNTGGSGASELGPAIELDTNAASTYDPYSYPAANFGDPSLAIDGDTTTGWTATVDPSVAPKMAEGVAIDLRSPRTIAHVKLFTSTLGMTVQVYGANGHALPGSITEPAWVPLSHALVIKKKSTTLKLRDVAKAFRFIALWISRAPQSAIGTPQAPGHVTVDEFELFPPK
jgi:hypothetical protein